MVSSVPADSQQATQAHWLVWLAAGARELSWALGHLPTDRWTAAPPPAQRLGTWPPARHVRHVVLNETRVLGPLVEALLGGPSEAIATRAELDQLDAAWDPSLSSEAVQGLIEELAGARYDLLRRLESSADSPGGLWERPLPDGVAPPGPAVCLDWALARAHQHELEHLSALWTLALYWDRTPPPAASRVSLPLHPADRLEESH